MTFLYLKKSFRHKFFFVRRFTLTHSLQPKSTICNNLFSMLRLSKKITINASFSSVYVFKLQLDFRKKTFTSFSHVDKLKLWIHWRMILGNIIRCSTLQIWVGYLIYFKLTPAAFFQWMSFISVKEINSLIGKLMTSIYLKVAIEKKWQIYPKPQFPNLIKSVKMSISGEL